MTLDQLQSLTEDELCIALHVVNFIKPVKPPIEISPIGLTWFRKGFLETKLIESVSWIKPEGLAAYSSLLTKLGIQHEIKQQIPESPPITELSVTQSI